RGSIGERSQVTPPTAYGVPRARACSATASAPTTSPPPPAPTHSTRAARRRAEAAGVRSGERRLGVVDDRRDLFGRPLELVVREHRGPLEREVALQLEPRPAAAVLVAHLHGHGARDAVGAEQQHVKRMAALPR